MASTVFEPQWVSRPADTIRQLMNERGWGIEDLSDGLGIGDPDTRRLVSGDLCIDAQLAVLLEKTIGGTSHFWLQRETQFRESKSALFIDEFAQNLPLAQMIRFGWVEKSSSWRKQAENVMAFFGVQSYSDVETLASRQFLAANFRASATFESNEYALAAWMRKAELISNSRSLQTWDPLKLQNSLDEIRRLTRIANPVKFLPILESIASNAGVAIVTLPPLQGCKVSGVAFRSEAGTPVIALSVRHLTDDHFWFTVFHEIGHLICHGIETTFVDDREAFTEEGVSSVEAEANQFAQDVLLPLGFSGLFIDRPSRISYRDIALFASQSGIGAGVVVGQLQHLGVIPRSRLNKAKRHYRWNDNQITLA